MLFLTRNVTARYFLLFWINIVYTLNANKESRRDMKSKNNLINHLEKNGQNHTSTAPLCEIIRQTENHLYFNIFISSAIPNILHLPKEEL